MAERDTLAEAKEAFKLAHDAEQEQRKQSLDDLRFALEGDQWPAEVKKQREIDGRPCLTYNRMPSFARQVINDARQNRPAIKCHPVGDGADRECAEIYDGLIRNIEYSSNADVAYDTALHFAVYSGRGYFVIRTDYASDDAFDQDIFIERVSNPFSVYGDPYSTAADSSDWNSAFITDLIDLDQFKRLYPGADTSDFESSKGSKDLLWCSGDKVQVAGWWSRDEVPSRVLKLSDGTILLEAEFLKLKDVLAAEGITVVGERPIRTHRVQQRVMSGSEILKTEQWLGKYIPIVPVFGEEVNIEGKRTFQSLFHHAKDAQRQYNYWKTTKTELVALQPKAPWVGRKGSFDSDPRWNSANTVNYPYLEYEGDVPPQRQPFAGVPAGALQEELGASDDMKNIIGIHDASLGARSNETSGRAILARQREGDVSTFNFIDNLTRGIKHGGRILVDLIPKVYDVPRIIRCIKEDGSNFSMPIKQPVIPSTAMPQGPEAQAQMGQQAPQGQPQYVPAPPGAETSPEIAGLIKVFDLSAGKYDVTVEAGPSFTTRREEASAQMMEFIRVFPQSAPLIGDVLAKNLDWPGSDEIAKRLAAMLPPQVQGQNPQLAALQQQLAQQDGAAKQAVGQLQQELAKLQQELTDRQREDIIKAQDAQTKRMDVIAKAAEAGFVFVTAPDGSIQAVPRAPTPTAPVGPSPELLIESDLKKREYDIRNKELSIAERKAQAEANALDVNSAAQQFAQIDVPAQQLQQHQAMTQAMIEALTRVAQSIEQKPTRHIAKAVKQADGSFVMEKVEVPLEQAMQPAPEALQ